MKTIHISDKAPETKLDWLALGEAIKAYSADYVQAPDAIASLVYRVADEKNKKYNGDAIRQLVDLTENIEKISFSAGSFTVKCLPFAECITALGERIAAGLPRDIAKPPGYNGKKVSAVKKPAKVAKLEPVAEPDTVPALPANPLDIISRKIESLGVTVTLSGTWLWISGDTYPLRDALKAIGCRWSGKRREWYWHAGLVSDIREIAA